MDGVLNYYKSKNKKELKRCAIKLKQDENKPSSFNRFIIYKKDQKTIKKTISFGAIKMISRYDDRSWEIVTKSGYKFRYFDDDPDRNERWVKLLKEEPLDDNHDEDQESIEENEQDSFNNIENEEIKDENNNEDDDEGEDENEGEDEVLNQSNSLNQELELDFSHVNLDEGVQVKIEPNRTDNKFLNIFSLDYTYIFKVNVFELVLLHNETNQEYTFELERIKRYGSFEDCFVFELGRNLEYGPGKIALKSVFANTIELNNIIYDLFTEKLVRLKEELIEYCYANKINSKTSSRHSLANKSSENVFIEKTNLVTSGNNIKNEIENSSGFVRTPSNPKLLSSRINIVTSPSGGLNTVEIPITLGNEKTQSDSNSRVLKSLNENISVTDSSNSSQERIIFDNHNNRFEITMQNEYTTVKNTVQTDYKKILNTTNLQPNGTKTNIAASHSTVNNPTNSNTPKKELKLLNEHPNLEDDSDTSTLVDTDESFYLDKYKPEYLNRKDQQQSNIFVDKDKSVYGRVKL